ncbi:MAG: DNA cytosine methyltransferase [Candidatus Rokubacteria bacterium]|nr:DNA cytosine methyltransferase [Candidatus Rokubacteria bacterium]
MVSDSKRRPRPSPSSKRPRLLDLFCGAGGFTLGFVWEGFEPIMGADLDKWAVKTYESNLGPHGVCKDIRKIRRFPKAEVIIGGPPCQGFSQLGSHIPNDPRNQLWRHYYRAVTQVRPKVFVMENVPELLKSAEFASFRELAEGLGYRVGADVLNAADFGVPQRRKRAIVIGALNKVPSLPVPTHFDLKSADLFSIDKEPWVTLKEAIGDLPLDPDGKNWHIGRNPTPKSKERYRCIPEGGNRWDLPKRLMPECWIRKVSGGTDLFGRLWWNQPAFTIRTEFFKPEKGRYLHPQADRPITHREAARIQTFPDEFIFVGSKIEVAKQIGNAVPCRLARAIAKEVKRLLTG